MKLREIAQYLGGTLDGDPDGEIFTIAKIEEAREGALTFLANPKYARYLAATRASAVIVGPTVRVEERPPELPPLTLVRVADPYVGFVRILAKFHPPQPPIPPGSHPAAVIDPSATIGTDVRIGAHAVIGARCRVGDRTIIAPCTVLGDDVRVGNDCILYANVSIREGCSIGARCILQSGAVIGSDGFGFAPKPDGTYEKIPQMGIVVVEDDVEIGANTTVDRATLGETRIRRGAKLDNLIQVAHNVTIGENTVMAAQCGVSGSTRIGHNVMVGGQVGFTGHIEVADGVRIGAQSGVHRSLTTANATYFGSPAYPHREAMRIHGAFPQLPELLATVRVLMKRIEELEKHPPTTP
jgi:UDP-3-O-[3-hydroxymyristoyl] glucosamine N-acyltransferase